MMEKGYKKLIVWQKADELAHQIYSETKKFPKDELYGLTSQLRRAAVSVPTNIVEGTGRQGKNELKQFTNIALGSLAETEYLLEFCFRLTYLNEHTYTKLEKLRKEVGGLLWNFYKSF
ncbi:MAG: four helix bundle protein [Candidatus Omnitrophica bacterium]|nr:four helix bundle protein [Candidatus Omnitrophota bacterium]